MSLDYLFGTNFIVEQVDEMYHFNSDSILLGSFLDTKKNDTVLDIGCGQGVLMLYASMSNPKILHGIDLFPEVVELANNNLKRNHINGECFTYSLQDYVKKFNDLYSLIICNPPYFRTKSHTLRNLNKYLSAARHDSYLSLDDLFSSVKKLMKNNGRFELVHRSSSFSIINKIAMKYGFRCTRFRVVYDSEGGSSKTILMEYRIDNKDTECFIELPSYLNDKNTFFLEKE